jgi:NmrA-like family
LLIFKKAGGNLGPAIINALHDANFTVSVLSRETSTSVFPSWATVLKTDYSLSSVLKSFRGQDAVVSAVGPMGIPEQTKMIDAAAEVGVKRFIPSEFGADRRKGIQPDFERLQQGKVKVFDHLVKKSEENKNFTWSSLATGPLLDWVSKVIS